MKVRIKTAHGYLSFQPDGRIEYRQVAGEWEEIDIEGLELVPVTPGPPGALPTPPVEEPALTPTATAAYVWAVKSELVAAGRDLSGAAGAFSITKRVAWGLRHTGIGLVSKPPPGNNWDGYSVDFLCWPNGDGVDILADAGGDNDPMWNIKPGEFAGKNRWRQPVQP